MNRLRLFAILGLAASLSLSACRARDEAPALPPWQRIDLWQLKPEAEIVPGNNKWLRPAIQEIGFLGAEEVRDMSRVPPQQLITFPRRTAGQIRVLEQLAGSRLKWRMRIGQDAYFSFIPLGTQKGCVCTYRFGVRDAGVIKELRRVEAQSVGPIAAAAVEVDLSPYAGHELDLLFQVDAAPEALGPVPGHPFPTALVGSPALYQRHELPARPSAAAASGPPNILLIGVDTLRADHVGAWGREPSLTPAMDRLAGQSDVWLDSYSAFNVTNPSFASILTGLYGKNHGVYDLKTPLPPSHTTLAEHLQGVGYETLAIISASHLGDHNSGLGQGFQDVTRATEHFAGELAVDMTLDWVSTRDGKHPFFIWLHLFDPHTPHTPPQPFALGFRPASAAGLDPVRAWVPFRAYGPRSFDEPVLGGNRDLYAGEVAYLDRQVGRLLGFLESRGLLENTLIALVADHGESLGEHGVRYRHVGLHDTTTHVPMMVRWPGAEREGRRIGGLVQTIDLFPTLVKAAGLEVPPVDGVDLRELTKDGKSGRRAVFAEHAGKLGLMVRTSEHKYILSQGNTRFFPDGAYLYDLKTDPGETKNLAGQGLPAEQRLADLLRRWLADRRGAPQARPRQQSDEERARLKALGYL
ncbi:MAG TPA: sulfatase [Thermoanaerobaculia bacterium]|nr:sulfatase [Thermoanaerobaculia bacterium]